MALREYFASEWLDPAGKHWNLAIPSPLANVYAKRLELLYAAFTLAGSLLHKHGSNERKKEFEEWFLMELVSLYIVV